MGNFSFEVRNSEKRNSMESFDIDTWFNELPEKLSQLWHMLMQPVPIAIFIIFLVFVWQKLKLSKKFAVFFNKFFKLIRTLIVIAIIILIASFFQYMNSGKSVDGNPQQIARQKQQPKTEQQK